MIALKTLKSSDVKSIAEFIAKEFNCEVDEKDVSLFFLEWEYSEMENESKKIQYYGSIIFND